MATVPLRRVGVGSPPATVPAVLPSPTFRRRLATALLLVGVVWGLYAQVREARKLHYRWQHQAWEAHEPAFWRLGTPPAVRMRQFLALADGLTDDTGTIVFSSHQRGHDALVLYLWASYSTPHRTVRPAHGPGFLEASEWWISWNTTLDKHHDRHRLEPVLHTDDGVLYRILP